MATAVTNAADRSRSAESQPSLGLASLVGAGFVLAGVALAAYLVPAVWDTTVRPMTSGLNPLAAGFLRVVAQVGVAAAVIWAGTAVAGRHPPRGLRGGITLAVSAAIAIFFIGRAVGLNLEGVETFGPVITLVVVGALLGLAVRVLFSPGGRRLMLNIEEQGWLHTFSYKQMQGQKVRRYTLLGLLLIGWSGVYSLINHESLGRGDWLLAMPFGLPTLSPLADLHYSAPVLLAAATFWLAWRAVNMPAFADFLIATEAEMNKVSWSSRRRLVQDTIVVLVTTLLLTVFLLVTDLFWGWLLSTVKVLPGRSPTAVQVDQTGGKKLSW